MVAYKTEKPQIFTKVQLISLFQEKIRFPLFISYLYKRTFERLGSA